MHLFIIRHAYAYEHGDPRWPDDSQRPLEAEGAKRFKRVVEVLADRGLEPELIATSPYVRCRQTAQIVAEHVSAKPQLVELPALQPGSDFEALVEWSQSQKAKSLAWVGHAPDVSRLAASLLGDEEASLRFAKGAVAAIRCDEPLGYAGGELQWLVTAKVLGL